MYSTISRKVHVRCMSYNHLHNKKKRNYAVGRFEVDSLETLMK